MGRESSTSVIIFTFLQRLFLPPSRDSLRERPDPAPPLHPEPEVSSPRPTERLTERLMTNRSCWTRISPHGIQRRIRSWKAPAVIFLCSVISCHLKQNKF